MRRDLHLAGDDLCPRSEHAWRHDARHTAAAVFARDRAAGGECAATSRITADAGYFRLPRDRTLIMGSRIEL